MPKLQLKGVWPRRLLAICLCGLAAALATTGVLPRVAGAAEETFNTKSPVFGAACETCVWGAAAGWVHDALALEGMSIRICTNCNGEPSPLVVAERRRPAPLNATALRRGETQINDPVDFGVTSLTRAEWAYQGAYDYKASGPHPHMRAIAFIEAPNYMIAAVPADSDIRSLDDLKTHKGLKISGAIDPMLRTMLDYYGVTDDVMKANGDTVAGGPGRQEADKADLIISSNGAFANAAESAMWPQVTEKNSLRFLPLADPIRAKLAKDFGLAEAVMPTGYMPGVDKPVPTVARRGQLIYGRDDMPNRYAYNLAKALDKHRDLIQFALVPFYYDTKTVAHTSVLPLHPGAARYYREVGYLK